MAHPLEQRLGTLKQRVLAIGACGTLLWALASAVGLLVVWVWVDLLLELSPEARVGALISGGAAAIGALCWGLVRNHRQVRREALARMLESAGGTKGQIVAGTDLLFANGNAGSGLTEGLRTIAVERAATLAGKVPLAQAATWRPIKRAVVAALAVAAVIVIGGLAAPRVARTEWQRFMDPFGETPGYTRLVFRVEPGDAMVAYGGGIEVKASVEGAAAERLDVVQVLPDGEDVVPMFADAGGSWRTTLTSLTSSRPYYIRARGGRSARFKISVLTVPKIESVTVHIAMPAYSRVKPYDGPLPAAGLVGLRGTEVEVKAKSNRPLSGGTMTLMVDEKAQEVAMSPTDAEGLEVRGTFKIAASGKVAISVRDREGQACTEPVSTSISLLPDERPFVRLLAPQSESFSTPDAVLPVEMVAEDDYGVTGVELLRSLNDSRALPQALTVPAPPPTKLPASQRIDLAKLGLRPGDVIKLYARVEDNDPEGAKGSESNVVRVTIISQEEYLRMAMAQDGLEVLLSKYDAAARRMEALETEMRKLRDDLAKGEGKTELSDADRERLARLSREAKQAAAETAESANMKLPFDIDEAFNERLKELAKKMDEIGGELDKESKKKPESNQGGVAMLDGLLGGLKAEQEEFAEEVTEPLDYLAKLIPLLLDQEKFVQLYEHEKDLVDRLTAVKNEDAGDDPKVKAKMRDWETEQGQIREALLKLVDDIKSHAAQLPDDDKLDEFRASAEDFVEKVRDAAPEVPMMFAEAALSDFGGPKAYEEAKNARDILSRFIAQCESTGKGLESALRFQPNLSKGMGKTLAQLKASMGRGSGGSSMGKSVGIYGRNPMGQAGKKKGGSGPTGAAAAATGTANPNDGVSVKAPGQDASVGGRAIPVPPPYRKRTSDYLQRVADELQPE